MPAAQLITSLTSTDPGDSLFMGVHHLTVGPLIKEESTDVSVVIHNDVLFSDQYLARVLLQKASIKVLTCRAVLPVDTATS